jgi:hypothetical protein
MSPAEFHTYLEMPGAFWMVILLVTLGPLVARPIATVMSS